MKIRFLTLPAVMASLAVCLTFASATRAGAQDLSTPKKAGLVFAKAVESGDIAAAKKVATGTDTQWAMVKALSDAMVALKGFSAAASDKFGPEGKLPDGMAMTLSSDFENSDEKIEGDTATLISKAKPNDPAPATFKKTGAGWILDLSNMEKDPSSAAMMQMLPAMTKVFTSVTADVKAGKFKTMQEAMAAVSQGMGAAMGAGPGGPGGPGSGPAPAPQP